MELFGFWAVRYCLKVLFEVCGLCIDHWNSSENILFLLSSFDPIRSIFSALQERLGIDL